MQTFVTVNRKGEHRHRYMDKHMITDWTVRDISFNHA